MKIKDVPKEMRKDYVLGYIKGVAEWGLEEHDIDHYRKQLLKIHAEILDLEKAEESDKQNG